MTAATKQAKPKQARQKNAPTNQPAAVSQPLDRIKIGNRHRHDLGDVAALAASIAAVGLLHPVVIRPDGTLIAGARRLKACRQLGWTELPVTVVNLDEIVRGEFAENAHRKDFLPTEVDAIRRALEPVEKAAAKARMKEGGRVGKLSTPSDAGKTRDKIGAFAGVSGRTVEKIAAIVDAAEADPEKYGHLVKEIDRSGRVDGVYRRLRVLRRAESLRLEPPPLPNRGPYRVIVADPPWDYDFDRDPRYLSKCPYPTMPVEEICAFPVPSITHKDCILWLWTTNTHLRDAFAVLDAWGFQYKTMLTWAKDRIGTGQWLRGQTEHCLMAVRGKPTVDLTNQTTLLMAPAGKHSQKPDKFYALVEKTCPASRYAELFSRRQRGENWDVHGNDVTTATTTFKAA
jgi:ParB/RepB/Spo0J family partition protein